jgi:hypothetical protein
MSCPDTKRWLDLPRKKLTGTLVLQASLKPSSAQPGTARLKPCSTFDGSSPGGWGQRKIQVLVQIGRLINPSGHLSRSRLFTILSGGTLAKAEIASRISLKDGVFAFERDLSVEALDEGCVAAA